MNTDVVSNSRQAVVIGAGFGGLALAIRLQASGIRTTLLEKRDKPGGRAYVYEDKGFTFDAGPTVITDPSALEELFTVAGRKLSDYVELLPVDPFYQLCWEDGTRFDYVNDQATLDAQIKSLDPADVEDLLARVEPLLRTVVARAVHRKRAPALSFVFAPGREE